VIVFGDGQQNYFELLFNLGAARNLSKRSSGVSDTMLGLLMDLLRTLCTPLTSLPIARWADRGNRRHSYTIALAG